MVTYFLKPLDGLKKMLANLFGFEVFLGHSPSGLSVVGIILRDLRDGFDGLGKVGEGESPMAGGEVFCPSCLLHDYGSP